MKKFLKGTLSLLLAVIMVISVAAPALPSIQLAPKASAARMWFESDSNMVMVDANTHKTASTYYLYGKADYICLKLDSDNKRDKFVFKLYSDSACEKEVMSYYTQLSPGKKYLNLAVNLAGVKSGTYYAKTYVKKHISMPYSDYSEIDTSTEKKYTVKIVRKGTKLTDMNAVMYGFENTINGPRVYWFSVSGATGYYVYRRNPDTKKYDYIGKASDSGEQLSYFTDKALKGKNTTAYYKVVAYKGKEKTPQSVEAVKVRVLKTPVVKASLSNDNTIDLSWSKVTSKSKYEVYIRTADTNWKKVDTTSGTEYTVSMDKRTSNKTYYFTVIALENGVYSGYNATGTAKYYLKAPVTKKSTYPKDGGIKVNWTLVDGADGYRVYRKKQNDTGWSKLADVGNVATYTDTSVNSNDIYYYTVKSFSNGKAGSYKGYGVVGTIVYEPEIQITVQDNLNALVSWDSQAGCEYTVYEKTSDGWNNRCSYISKPEVLLKHYGYSIQAYTFTVSASRAGVVSKYGNNVVSYTAYPKPEFTSISKDANAAYISWKKPTGAESCLLYKKTADTDYELCAEVDGTSYVDTQVVNDVAYSYKVMYKYNGEIIDWIFDERNVTFVSEDVGFVEKEYYTEYIKISNWPRIGVYNLEIADYASNANYCLYKKIESGWKMCGDSVSDGKICLERSYGEGEYALCKMYSDGRITCLPEQCFYVEVPQLPQNIQYTTTKSKTETADKITITWDSTGLDVDSVVVAGSSQTIEVPVGDNQLTADNPPKTGSVTYRLSTRKGNFYSDTKYVSCNNMIAPEVTAKAHRQDYEDGILVEWDSNDLYDCVFYVYRKAPGETSWKRVATINNYLLSGNNKYFDTKVSGVNDYTYTVKIKYNNEYSPYSKTGCTARFVETPRFTGYKCTANGFKLTWNKLSGADGYVIRRYDTEAKKWVTLKKIENGNVTSFTDTSVKSGEKYRYAIRAFSGDVYSSYYIPGYKLYLAQPSIKSLTKTSKGVNIKINAVNGATTYYVYRKAAGATKWSRIATVKTTSYIDTKVKSGTKYTYTVKAGKSDVYSSYNTKGWTITYKK